MKKITKAALTLGGLLAFLLPQIYYQKKEKLYRSTSSVHSAQPLPITEISRRGDIVVLGATGLGGAALSAELYPHPDPKGLVLVIHGIQEHKGRYEDFARYLQGKGYAVLAADIRGHGLSVSELHPRGYMDIATALAQDQLLFTRYLKTLYPGVPLHLFAHSLGSLIARLYLQEHDEELSSLIITGAPQYFPGVELTLPFARCLTYYSGEILFPLLSRFRGSFLRFAEERRLRKIASDPLYQQRFQLRGLMTLFELEKALKRTQDYRRKNADLRILSLCGEWDLFYAGGMSGITRTIHLLREVGYKNLISVVYKKMPHEILQDKDRERVYMDILSFLEN